MNNTGATIVLACCMAIVDRVEAWGIMPFWPSLFLALGFAYLMGRYATGIIRRWWQGG